jgi:hypothetical protein
MQRRIKRKGAKPNRKGKGKSAMKVAHDHHIRSFEDIRKPKYRAIGPTQTVPPFPFRKKTEFWGNALVVGSSFQVHTGLTGDNIPGAAAAFGGAFAFAIGDVPDISALTALFDTFILYKIVLRILARTPATTNFSQLFLVVDYDDSTAMPSLIKVVSYNNVQELRGCVTPNQNDSMMITLEPAQDITSFAGEVSAPATWQNIATTSNPHYGVKFWHQCTATTDAQWRVDAMYYYGFKNTQ